MSLKRDIVNETTLVSNANENDDDAPPRLETTETDTKHNARIEERDQDEVTSSKMQQQANTVKNTGNADDDEHGKEEENQQNAKKNKSILVTSEVGYARMYHASKLSHDRNMFVTTVNKNEPKAWMNEVRELQKLPIIMKAFGASSRHRNLQSAYNLAANDMELDLTGIIADGSFVAVIESSLWEEEERLAKDDVGSNRNVAEFDKVCEYLTTWCAKRAEEKDNDAQAATDSKRFDQQSHCSIKDLQTLHWRLESAISNAGGEVDARKVVGWHFVDETSVALTFWTAQQLCPIEVAISATTTTASTSITADEVTVQKGFATNLASERNAQCFKNLSVVYHFCASLLRARAVPLALNLWRDAVEREGEYATAYKTLLAKPDFSRIAKLLVRKTIGPNELRVLKYADIPETLSAEDRDYLRETIDDTALPTRLATAYEKTRAYALPLMRAAARIISILAGGSVRARVRGDARTLPPAMKLNLNTLAKHVQAKFKGVFLNSTALYIRYADAVATRGIGYCGDIEKVIVAATPVNRDGDDIITNIDNGESQFCNVSATSMLESMFGRGKYQHLALAVKNLLRKFYDNKFVGQYAIDDVTTLTKEHVQQIFIDVAKLAACGAFMKYEAWTTHRETPRYARHTIRRFIRWIVHAAKESQSAINGASTSKTTKSTNAKATSTKAKATKSKKSVSVATSVTSAVNKAANMANANSDKTTAKEISTKSAQVNKRVQSEIDETADGWALFDNVDVRNARKKTKLASNSLSTGIGGATTTTTTAFEKVTNEERQVVYQLLASLVGIKEQALTKSNFGTREDWIAQFGQLRLEDVGGAGDCQFRVLAALVHHHPDKFALVRHQIAQYMRAHPKEFAEAHWDSHSRKKDKDRDSVSVFDSLASYCDAIEHDGEWGTFHTLRAAAALYGVAIQVLSSASGGCKLPLIGALSEAHPIPLVIGHYDEFHFVVVRENL